MTAAIELPHPGEVIDGFRLEERIHTGGMGVVYRVSAADDPGFPLVMKIPRLGHGEPGEGLITFEVEGMLLPALKGPHVPRFVAAGDIAVRPYLVMEYVEGRSLSEWVDGPVAPEEIARLGGAIATALHALHLQDAIHLDMKPGNVLLRPGGEAVLIDFGLAHHAHYPDLLAEELRRPAGSPPYISPEQILGVRSDPRSDIFALGVILYELATGRLPFGAPTSAGGLRKRLWRDPVPPRAVNPAVPEWLQEVILRCLQPDAERRYASAAQVAFELAHPDQVAVTDRGRRLRRAGPLKVIRRFVRAAGLEPQYESRPSAQLSGASIVLAAIATTHTNEAQFAAIRQTAMRLMAMQGHTRLACVTVIRPSPELGGSRIEETATARRIQHLVLLRHWAEPLGLPPGRISFHVIEANDPAAALLDYARGNHVDHIVIGAPPPDAPLKGLLGTVATKVAIEAPCTVTVVRYRGE